MFGDFVGDGGLICKQCSGHRCQVSSGGKAHDAYFGWVDTESGGIVTDILDRAERIVQLGRVFVRCGQAILEYENGDSDVIKFQSDRYAFYANSNVAVSAARYNNYRCSVGFFGSVNG